MGEIFSPVDGVIRDLAPIVLHTLAAKCGWRFYRQIPGTSKETMPGIGYELLKEQRPQWYAIQTRSRFEKSVATLLGAKEVEHYLPAFGEMHQWKDRKKFVERPAFPGYVFVRFQDGGAARLDILKIPGAVLLLG